MLVERGSSPNGVRERKTAPTGMIERIDVLLKEVLAEVVESTEAHQER